MSAAGRRPNDHRRIARRLSGKIAGELIAGFIVLDILFFVFLAALSTYPEGLPAGFLNSGKLFTGIGLVLDALWQTIWQWICIGLSALWPLIPLGVIEVLLIVGSSVKLRGAIRVQLEPLRELRVAADAFASVAADAEQTAQGLQREPLHTARQGVEQSGEALRRLAEALRQVDASDMDAHIAADSVSAELRPLLEAISGMLSRLEAAYAAQAKFVADASHELRTPIAVIQGYANLLARWGSEEPETLRESIDAIRFEADAMKQLVNQLLFLARGDSDTLCLERKQIDLVPILREVLREVLLIDTAPETDADEAEHDEASGDSGVGRHELEARLPEEGVFVEADPALIKQLVRILVDNSVKYTPEGGGILLSVRADMAAGRALISVRDDGPGISAELLPHIFDRFVRADEARGRNMGGLGLGLSIAKQIAECHDGAIEVYSMEGVGSQFSVTLPLAGA